MEQIFYFLGLIPIINELYFISNMKAINTRDKELERLNTEDPTGAAKLVLKSGCWYILATIFYMIWTIVGLFTFQSGLFLVIILIGLIASKVDKNNIVYHTMDSVFCIGVILFIIYNYTTLQINFSVFKLLGF